MLNFKSFKKGLLGCALLCGLILSHSSPAMANTTDFYTDLTNWQNALSGYSIESWITTSENIGKANEVTSDPGPNTKVGATLTFDSTNTGLSSSFQVESLQYERLEVKNIEAGFTFDDADGGLAHDDDFNNALSVGDMDDFEDDDWSLSLLSGPSMTGFGVELRDNRFETGESISLYNGASLITTLYFSDYYSPLPTSVANNFIGIATDYSFDKIVFNEDAGGDDIAIADFRFANTAVAPEPASTALFLSGLSTMGIFRWRRRKN
jgi:hypothetical protein